MNNSRIQASNPTVDVIIPVYNGAVFVFSAIESAAKQTFRPNSIIVIDDGSTDTTPNVVKKYSGPVPLNYIRQDNRGLSTARNAGWRKSRAEFVAFLDADDVWLPGKLAAQVEVFKTSNDTDLNLVYCGYHHIDEIGQPVNLPGLPIIHPSLRGKVFEDLLPMNQISGSGSAVLVRRSALEKVGGFDETLRALEDWDMWLKIAQQGSIDYVDQDLVGIRTHAGGMQQNSDRMMEATVSFMGAWLQRLPDSTPPPRRWVQTLARCAGNSWPPDKFWNALNRQMPPASRQKLLQLIRREMKVYATIRLASLPFEWIIRRPWRK